MVDSDETRPDHIGPARSLCVPKKIEIRRRGEKETGRVGRKKARKRNRSIIKLRNS